VVPLVFKTSLGAVRSPEGSTPSLLRQHEVVDVRQRSLEAESCGMRRSEAKLQVRNHSHNRGAGIGAAANRANSR
jgi:hypothetical protein